MRYKLILIFFIFLQSCTNNYLSSEYKQLYSSSGFAYIYNDVDFKEKIIKGKLSNDIPQISHQYLKTGTLIKLINPKTNENIVLKNTKRINSRKLSRII